MLAADTGDVNVEETRRGGASAVVRPRASRFGKPCGMIQNPF
jgi:hypothetical protein